MFKPRLRHGVGGYLDDEHRLHFIVYTKSLRKVFSSTDEVTTLVSLLDGQRTTEELFAHLVESYPTFTYDQYKQIIDTLSSEGLIVFDSSSKPITEDVRTIHDRQVQFWEEMTTQVYGTDKYQERVQNSRVAVFGLGGTGSWIGMGLALSGVKHITIVDCDTVEASNLHRQILFTQENIGQSKVDAATRALRRIKNDLEITAHSIRIDEHSDLQAIISNHDLVFNCMDEPDINTTSAWVASACYDLGIPHIVGGGYAGHFGLIGPTIIPGQTACWECYQANHKEEKLDLKPLTPWAPRRSSASIAPIAAIVANIQLWDALRILSRVGSPTGINKTGEIDFMTLSIRWKELSTEHFCERCKGIATSVSKEGINQ